MPSKCYLNIHNKDSFAQQSSIRVTGKPYVPFGLTDIDCIKVYVIDILSQTWRNTSKRSLSTKPAILVRRPYSGQESNGATPSRDRQSART